MEIPTKEIIERLDSRLVNGIIGPVALEAIDTIKAQAREIRDLQTTICRLKDDYRISNDLRVLEAGNETNN